MTGRRNRPCVPEEASKTGSASVCDSRDPYLVSYTDLHSAVTLAESSERKLAPCAIRARGQMGEISNLAKYPALLQVLSVVIMKKSLPSNV